jgi:hypothetical protein
MFELIDYLVWMMRLEELLIDFNMDYGLYGIGFLRKNLLPKLWKLLETFGSINVAAKIKI